MPHHLEDLARLPRAELEHIFRYGETPDFGALEGWVFRGANVGARLPTISISG